MSEPNQVPVLLVHAGPGAGRVLPLTGDRLVLGRDPAAGLPFDAPGVSREHCAFIRDETGWSVRDLGARNGTRLNGRPLASDDIILSEGDRLVCGTVELEFALDRGGADRVRVVQGPLAGRALPLRSSIAILGRAASDADVALNDHAASRQNTELRFVDGLWTVRDLGSRNGTDYDGARLPAEVVVPLHSGARLRIGASTVDFLDRRVEDLANHVLFGYRLVERVAAGPGAVVYRGRGEDGSLVALKVLDPGRACNAIALARFISSGRTQTRWQHPHIVPTLAAERNEEHAVVISAWIGGGCLATRLGADQVIPPDIALDWAIDMTRGLQAAADQGQPHRALRPGNCLVADDGKVMIGDGAAATPYDPHLPHGPVPPHYLAPEELDGSEPTALGNQFSLGCILYHALTGRAPFGAPDRSVVAQSRLTQTLPTVEGLSAEITKVLARLLARQAADRYPSWAEVLTDLEAVREGQGPQTGLLPPGRSVLTGSGPARAAPPGRGSTRAVQRSDTAAVDTDVIAQRRARPRADTVVIPGWALKGSIAFILILLIIGFALPALNRSNRSDAQSTATPTAPQPALAPAARQPVPVPTATPANAAGAPVASEPYGAAVRASLDLIRGDQWESATLIANDGAEQSGEVRWDGTTLSLRRSGAVAAVPANRVSAIRFTPPQDPDAQQGDARFASRRYAEAAEAYRAALVRHPNHPHVRQRLAEAQARAEQVHAVREALPTAIESGDQRLILERLTTYIDLADPRRLEPAWRDAMLAAWADQHADVDPADAQRWREAAARTGLTLEIPSTAVATVAEATPPADVTPAPAADDLFARDPAPAFAPRIVVSGRVGGAGTQRVHRVGIDGTIAWGQGDGFAIRVDLATGQTSLTGTPTDDSAPRPVATSSQPREAMQLDDPRLGQTYVITTKQVHPILQQPLLTSSAGWTCWGWSYDAIAADTKDVPWGPLVADSRGHDVWLMPQGRIGVRCWTDGGNSVLTRDPRDLRAPNPALEARQPSLAAANGMATLFLLIDPTVGTPLSGTFISGPVTAQAIDAWGRVYLPRPAADAAPLASSAADAGAGFLVLDADLRHTALSLRLGGGTSNGSEAFDVIAVHDGWLVLGGTTAADLPALDGSAPRAPSDGQDGFFSVVRLW